MINTKEFIENLTDAGVSLFAGVPDSLLKSFCAYVTDNLGNRHIITANEGGAIGLATGHHLATGGMACVYMQNSGQGNAVNPLASLADPDVYSIPMILLVGWRGEPGVHDEPQHIKQGKITLSLFETMGIPTYVIPDDDTWRHTVAKACTEAIGKSAPVALIVRKGLFSEYKLETKAPDISKLPREQAIEHVLDQLQSDCMIVSTTGMISRELYETREKRSNEDNLASCHNHDFLTVGSMGHASMIAMGIARAHPNRRVICLDGDGASIMQMGNMAIVGQSECANLTHIVLNNSAHDSVGGQPTVGKNINLRQIAEACGYEVIDNLSDIHNGTSPAFLEIRVAKGARANLGRPKERPQNNKQLFMSTLMED